MAPTVGATAAAARATTRSQPAQYASIVQLDEHETANPKDEVVSPSSNWEVAYVYAFVTKFYPDLRDTTTPQSLLTDVTSLEQALIDSSPPPGSKVAKVPPPPKPNNMHYYYDYPFEEMQKALEDHAAAAAAKAAAAAAAANGADTVASTSAPGTPGADGIAPTSDSATAVEGTPAAEDGTEGDAADGADAGPTLAEQTPAAAPLLIEIIKRFESNLHLPEFENSHGRRDWFSWLVRFVNKRLAMYNRGGFDWHYNLLKRPGVKSGSEREQEFWLLKWHDKIHLMRQMVDYQLMHSKKIRDSIDVHYDLGKQRVAKRDAASNPLVIEPLGRIGSRTLYHLDDSPRVYSSLVDIEHFPATDDWLAYDEERLVWRALSSSVEQYERVLGELPEPDRQVQEQRRIALEAFNVAQEAEINAASALQQQVQASGGGAASKKKGKSGAAAAAAAAASSTLQQNLNATGVAVRAAAKALTKPAKLWQEQSDEQLTRYKLEEDLEDVKEFQKAFDAINSKRQRAATRLADKDHRYARSLAKYDTGYGVASGSSSSSSTGRSSRLRTQPRQVDYVYDAHANSNGHGQGQGQGDASGSSPPATNSRKRGRAAAVSVDKDGYLVDASDPSAIGEDVGAVAGGSTSRRSTREWNGGERRSSRILLKEEGGTLPWDVATELPNVIESGAALQIDATAQGSSTTKGTSELPETGTGSGSGSGLGLGQGSVEFVKKEEVKPDEVTGTVPPPPPAAAAAAAAANGADPNGTNGVEHAAKAMATGDDDAGAGAGVGGLLHAEATASDKMELDQA